MQVTHSITAKFVLFCSLCSVLILPVSLSATYKGCYTDNEARALPVQLMVSGATMESCVLAAKAQGYAYAGLQYGGSCFAGNTLGLAKDADTACNMPCAANNGETCGGSWHNSVYDTGITPPQPPSATPLGCYVDDANRQLPVALMEAGATVETCVWAAQARNLLYAGVQYGGQCFGGSSLGTYAKASPSDCSMPCTANRSETCGGTWRNSVYATNVTLPPKIASANFVGCYQDDDNRQLPVSMMSSGATVDSCVAAAKAAGYTYAGVQFYGQCFAGNSLGNYQKATDNECNGRCTADISEVCGGGWRNIVYKTSGGSSSCGTGLTSCSGQCVSLSTDAKNCGSCGHACSSGQSCSNGVCVYPGGCLTACGSGQTCCNASCRDLQTDSQNCGSCGQACGSGNYCYKGTCLPNGTTMCPDGHTCGQGQSCCGNTCTTSGFNTCCYQGNANAYACKKDAYLGCCGTSNCCCSISTGKQDPSCHE